LSAPREPALRPEFGPSLPQVLRARLGVPVRVTAVLGLLVAGAVVAALLLARADEVRYVHRSAPVFNLRYADVLERLPPRPGVLLALEGRRGDLFLQGMSIRPLRLPPYRGAVSGMLPLYAVRHMEDVRRRFGAIDVLEEGKARINDAPGYQVGFRARRQGRTLYGREVLLVPDEPGAREGVAITVVQTNAVGAHSIEDAGTVGAIKKPFRSFRFGTEAK